MSVELKGKLIKKLPVVKGEGRNGPWQKQEFVIETDDQFPRKICISIWGDKIRNLEGFAEGDILKVDANIESREYNERWYTDVRAWRIERIGEDGLPPLPPDVPPAGDVPPLPPEEADNGEGDLPF